MKKIAGLACICFFTSRCFAQDYIITDSTYHQGKITRHGKGEIAFRIQGVEGYTMYPLNEIKEFKQGNTVYEGFVVNGERKFYGRVVAGNISLYRNKNLFILKKGSDVIPLDKKNFRTTVASVISCEGPDQSFSNVTYSKASLRNLIQESNNGTCNPDAIPYRKLGLYLGYNALKYELVDDAGGKISQSVSAPAVGIFLDAPVYKAPWLYFSGDLSWLSAKPIFYSATDKNTSYLDLRVNQLTAHLGFKVLIGRGPIVPYLRIGGFGAYGNLKSPDGNIVTKLNGTTVEITKTDFNGEGSAFYGYQAGAGLEIKINKRKRIHLEGRYLRSSTNSVQPFKINYSNVCFNLGINI
jgi:hypothetical protein